MTNSTLILYAVITAAISYLLGSLNFSIIFTSLFNKIDIRSVGSGNAGLTNVVRSTNAVTSIFALIGDFGKTIASCLIANAIFGASQYPGLSVFIAYWAGFFCVIGHMFPIFFKFKGGKGVLPASAMLIMISPSKPYIFIACIAVFALFAILTKIISLASIAAVLTFPLATWFLYDPIISEQGTDNTAFFSYLFSDTRYLLTVLSTVLPFIILLRHYKNIIRMLESRERQFSFSHKKEVEQSLIQISDSKILQNKLFAVKCIGIYMIAACFIQKLNPLRLHAYIKAPLVNMLSEVESLRSVFNLLAGGGFISNLMYYISVVSALVGLIAIGIMIFGITASFINGNLMKKGIFLCKFSSLFIMIASALVIIGVIIFNIALGGYTDLTFRLRIPIADAINLFLSVMMFKLTSEITKNESEGSKIPAGE